jgi:adenosylcobinamide hydrolase
MAEPELLTREEDGAELAVAVWRLPTPLLALSSAPYGGGWGVRRWVLAAQVAGGYARLDPAAHLAELAAGLALRGPGIGMLTAVDVRQVRTSQEDGIEVAATVGLSHPTWAAAPETAPATVTGPGGAGTVQGGPGRVNGGPGTVNIIAVLDRRLSPAALVNAVMTVTEAKSQAMWDASYPATGTASDAVAVLCPAAGPEEAFAGPRSPVGARLARAVHRAVLDGSPRARAR